MAPSFASLQGRVALVSDFLGDTDAVVSLVAGGAHPRHRRLRRPRRGFAGVGSLLRAALVADPETPALQRPLIPATRGAYLASFARWRSELATIFIAPARTTS